MARNKSKLEALKEECSGTGGQIVLFPGDTTKETDRDHCVKTAIEKFGGIDVLVQAAGIISNGTVESTSEAQWNEMMDINLNSVFRMMQLALPSVISRKGNFVNVSSVTGTRAFPVFWLTA